MTTLRKNGRAMRVLIVEDEPVIGWDMQITLTQAGADIVAIENRASRAIETLPTLRPDIVLIDIRLKGIDEGFRVAEACRALGVPAIFISGLADRLTKQRAQALDIPLVLKPTFGSDLIAAVRRAAGLDGQAIACAARVWQVSALPRRARPMVPGASRAAAILRAADRVLAEHKGLIAVQLDRMEQAQRLIAAAARTRENLIRDVAACRARFARLAMRAASLLQRDLAAPTSDRAR